ncbi:hypothetical protein [Elizabethkingia anophelis]|uniref:hypothetical protein n=1 Tax=Elizabethkingia anophelis TaxID=1117645 RepID=UPI0038921A79
MKKHLFYHVLWGILVLFLLFSCRSEESAIEKTNNLTQAKALFEKGNYQFPVLKYTSEIDWNNPIYSQGNGYETVEIPLVLNKGVNIGGSVNAKHRLLFRKTQKDNSWNVYYLFIMPETTKENTIDNVSFQSVSNDFKGKVIVLNSDNKIVDHLVFSNDIQIQKSASTKLNTVAYAKPDVKCYNYGILYDDGTFEALYFLGCYGGADGGYNGSGYGGSHGGGSGGGGSSSQSADQWAKDHIDASDLKNNKCVDDVYQKLKNKSELFNNLLGKFDGKSILDLKLVITDMGENNKVAVTEIKNVNKGFVTIHFNPNYMGSTEFARASTIIHETLHAYMTWQLVNSGWNGIDNAESYQKIDEKNLPTLLKAYKDRNYDPGASEHDFMANYYIPKIVNALKAYDPDLGTDSEYNALAWLGLQGTSLYQELKKTDPDREATIDALLRDNVKTEKCKN